jgi:hypothetical protein
LHWQTTRFSIDLVRPQVMGIVNVTPDSFSDGGRFFDHAAALAHCDRLVADGADLLDIGGDAVDGRWIESAFAVAGKHLARHFKQDSPVAGPSGLRLVRFGHRLVPPCRRRYRIRP